MSSMIIKGKGVSNGISIGKAIVLSHTHVPLIKIFIADELLESELERFKDAIRMTKSQLLTLREELEHKLGKSHSFILESQLSILEDPLFYDRCIEQIRNNKVNSEWAIQEVYNELETAFSEIPEQYFRERFNDVEDALIRVQYNLAGYKKHDLSVAKEKFILIAHELTPSDLAEIHKSTLMGIVLEKGGRTSHTVILAKSLGIPVVVNVSDVTKKITSNDMIIVDGYDGQVISNPSKLQLQEYLNKRNYYIERSNILLKLRDLASVTLDNKKMSLLANIEFPEEINAAKISGADGIGLYRSEYVYLSKPSALPSEEDHFAVYKQLAEHTQDTFVTIRTMDLGPDKLGNLVGYNAEDNPVLGMRAIRLCLDCQDIFYTQLRAILRASAYGNVQILIPMVSTAEEIVDVKRILEEVKTDLGNNHIPFDYNIKLGCMIEVPAAALAIDLIAPQVDFLSIGTNDLIQFLLAIDRDNEKLTHLYVPLHPVVLRLLHEMRLKARKMNKPINICGEMASDPLYIMMLIGLGYTTLSMNPASIPLIKHLIRSISFKEAEILANAALKMKTSAEIEDLVLEKMNLLFPEGFLSHSTLRSLDS